MKMYRVSLIISTILCCMHLISADTVNLERVIREVCTNSDSVKMMRETLNKSKLMIKEKKSAAFPNVSGTIAAARNHNSYATMGDLARMIPDKTMPYFDAAISINQPIYTFGKINTAIKVANEFDLSTQCSYKRNLQQLQLSAIDAFYRAVLAEMSLNVLERSLARQKELSEFLERNFKLGSGSKAQILATNAELGNHYPLIMQARQDARAAKMYLSVLMGREVTDTIQVDTASVIKALEILQIPDKEMALTAALSSRTDLQSLEYLSKANEGGMKIFKSMYLPTIAGQAAFDMGGKEFLNMVDRSFQNWKIGVALQWNMFDGFANSSVAKQYQSDSRKLQTAKSMAIKYLEIEIDNALSECSTADSNLSVAKEMFSASQESYNLTNENFKQGSGQFAELQLAEDRLRQGEFGIMNARYRQMRSRAALLVAMGRDIVNLEDK